MSVVEERPLALPDVVLRPAVANAFESAVEQLATSIRLGVFRPGDCLPPERELAERLGIARGTIRDAMAALREAGLVETRRGRDGGSFVTDGAAEEMAQSASYRPSQVRDLLDFRHVVEPGAAELAARRDLTPEQRDLLASCGRDVAEAPDDPARRLADSRLHLVVATLTGSPLILDAVTRVQDGLDALLRRIPVLRTNIEHSDEQHAAIVDAIQESDPEAARSAMAEHVEATSALLRGLIG